MKKFFEKLLWKTLKWETQIALYRHRPYVVAITGSVGKTTTKEAIYHLLAKSEQYTRKQVRKTPGNLNTETGVPLAVLGFKKEAKGAGWLLIVVKGLFRALFTKNYPDLLVLEMAADKKGDLSYLCSFVHPTISIVTAVGEAHTEFFGDIKGVVREKAILVQVLNKDEFAILNYDNSYTRSLATKTKAHVQLFGEDKRAHLYFSDLVQSPSGSKFKIHYKGAVFLVKSSTFGRQYVFAILVAILCGKILGIKIDHAVEAFQDFQGITGRGKLFHGPKQSILIDESYNSNPTSCQLALENLKEFKADGRKIVVLGDMLELGKDSSYLHQKIGYIAGEVGERFYLVGEYADDFKKGIIRKNKTQEVFIFPSSRQAGLAIKKDLQKNDIILFKASQKIAMKKALEVVKG